MDRYDGLRGFVHARGPALSRTAFLLTGDRHAAEDLVQETYAETVRRWRSIDGADPEPYVRRILYSRFVDGLRRRHLVELPADAVPEQTTRDAWDVAAVDRLTLAGALTRITAHQRAMLVLRFYDDLTEVQTAEALGVSQSTVKSQTRLALKRLRELAPEVLATFTVAAATEEVAE